MDGCGRCRSWWQRRRRLQKPHGLLDVDDPDLLLAGRMPQRINAQRVRKGLEALDESPENAPMFASLIFHSLAARYAKVLDRVAFHSGKKLKRLFVVGGASQNDYLNRLTKEATGLEVFRGAAESSTVGNFAVQMAVLEGSRDAVTGAYAEQVSRWAGLFVAALEHGGAMKRVRDRLPLHVYTLHLTWLLRPRRR